MVQISKPICNGLVVCIYQIPEGRPYSAHGLKVGRGLVLEVGRVGDLARLPDALVGRVVNHRSGPLALIFRVLLHRRGPFTTSGDFLALGVGNSGRDPVTILLVIPVLGLFSFGVRNADRFILEPVFGLGSVLINNLVGSILVPVVRLGGFRVRNLGVINPVGRLLVLGIVDLLLWVNRRAEVLKEGAILDRLAVNQDLEGLIGLDNQSVQAGELGGTSSRRSLEMLLLIFAGLGVLVTEDEVNLKSLGTDIAYPPWLS